MGGAPVSRYHISANELTWEDAELFCNLQCNNHLVSIHKSAEYKQLLTSINSPILHNGNGDIWIGLEYIDGVYSWTDNTSFDFNNNISSIPWSESNDIAMSADLYSCTYLDAMDNYLWHNINDTECTSVYNRFVCNKCENTLNKYIIITDNEMTHNEANDYCQSQFGTDLASIHTKNDNIDASLLCNLATRDLREFNESNLCWIGLQKYSEYNQLDGIWHFADNTTFDFGNIYDEYPWKYNQPNNGINAIYPYDDPWHSNCAVLEVEGSIDIEGLWNDRFCGWDLPFLCNAPSEFCYPQNWMDLSQSTDVNKTPYWIFNHCKVENINNDYNDLNQSNVHLLILYRGQYHWKSIIFEYRWKIITNINYNKSIGKSGVEMSFLADFVKDISYIFYIGIAIKQDQKTLFIEYISLSSPNLYYDGVNSSIVNETDITSFYDDNVYYALKVELTMNDIFCIYLNDELLLLWKPNDAEMENNYYLSNFALKNINVSSHSTSFFANGEVLKYPIFTDDPTMSPSILPTVEPTTNIPTTMEPTLEPTTNKPTTNEPTTDKPTTNEPTTNIPTTNIPTTNIQTTNEPISKEGGVVMSTTNGIDTNNSTHSDIKSNTESIEDILVMVGIIVVSILIITSFCLLWYIQRKKRKQRLTHINNISINMANITQKGLTMNAVYSSSINTNDIGLRHNDITNIRTDNIIQTNMISQVEEKEDVDDQQSIINLQEGDNGDHDAMDYSDAMSDIDDDDENENENDDDAQSEIEGVNVCRPNEGITSDQNQYRTTKGNSLSN